MPQPFPSPLFMPSTPAQLAQMVAESKAAEATAPVEAAPAPAAPAPAAPAEAAPVEAAPVEVPAHRALLDTADAVVDALGTEPGPDADGVPSDDDAP